MILEQNVHVTESVTKFAGWEQNLVSEFLGENLIYASKH